MLDGATGQVRLSFGIGGEALTHEMQLNPRTQMEERVCLGRGGWGAVYKATWRHQSVAVKVLMSQGLTASAQYV